MNEEPKDIKSIFAEALEKKTPQDRAAYLDKACGGDADLRSKLESLLESLDQAGSFLDAPAFDVTVTFDKSPLTEGPGTVIGPYKLLEKIGEGGMAYVYMAEQERPLRRRVALKIIKLGMDTKQVIARFEVERQALAVMDHPNIAKVFDAGATETGRPYFVMELVKGVSITEYCDKNKLNTPERLDLFIQVCNAVQHAHQKGIIHRDIKPSNVMVTLHDGKPVPKVIDFGIAKATIQRLTEKTLFTKYAQMIGTPEYMSPEQAEMSGLDIDTRADIYSLGVLLYELLTGTTPFDAEDLRSKGYGEMQRIIRETEPLKPSTKLSTMGDALTGVAEHRKTNPDLLAKLVRGDLDWIVMKTLEKDRTRRYETVSSLAADVKRHLNEEPVEAGPPGATYRIGKFIRKHRRTVAAVLVIAATLIIGLIVSTTLYFIADHARNREAIARATAEQSQKAEEEQRKLAETKAEDLRRSLYINSVALADSSYQQGNISRVRQLLDASPNDLRGWEWNRLNYISDQSLMTLRDNTGGVHSIAFTPDGKYIVSGSEDGSVKVWNSANAKETMTLSGHTARVRSVAVSPSGKRIASASLDTTVKIWDIAGGSEVMTLHGHDDGVWSVAFSPDSKRIASGGDNGVIKIWDAEVGTLLTTIAGQKSFAGEKPPAWSVAFSPDGKHIASNDIAALTVWDSNNGVVRMTIPTPHKYGLQCVAYSPDGKHIVSCGGDKKIKIWDASTGDEVLTMSSPQRGTLHCVAFSPDGRRIVSAGRDTMIKVWDALTGDEQMTLRGHNGDVWQAKFSPDGNRIASCSFFDGAIKIWGTTIDRERVVLRGHKGWVISVALSPDGTRLASSSSDGIIKIWDVKSGAELMTLRGHEGDVDCIAFSGDGNRIVSGGGDKTIRVWDATSGNEIMSLRGHDDYINSVTFSPDGKYLVSGGGEKDKTIKVWDAMGGIELATLRGHTGHISSVAVSSDGQRILSGGCCDGNDIVDGTIRVWDMSSGTELIRCRHGAGVTSAAFSPEGKYVVSGGSDTDRTIKIWDANSGNELMSLIGHDNGVSSLTFSPDGKRILSGSKDETAKLWDVATGTEVMTLPAQNAVWSSAFSSDGRTIAISDGNMVTLFESAVPAGGYEPRKNGEAARKIVDELYQKYGFYYEVIDKISADKTLDEPIRKLALQIANSRKWEDAQKLKEQSWEVVRLPAQNTEAYRLALENSEKANRMEPNNPYIPPIMSTITLGAAQYRVGKYEDAIKTLTKADGLVPNLSVILAWLGAAQYRAGAYEDALKTFTRSEKIRADAHLEPDPDVAFIAMALHQLGRTEEAKPALERLRDLCKEERFAEDQEAQGFLAEAEKLIGGENK